MGHDVHFLQRLDRVSDAHVELALTLYRDADLLREVLGRAGLPDGTERLAISLDDPVEGPFVVVSRSGRFVTCLGRGMRLDRDPVPVVTRERLDAAAARVQRMRDELALVKKLRDEGGEGIAARAIQEMQQDGLAFPREAMETLLSVQPLIAQSCATSFARYLEFLLENQAQFSYLRFDRLTPRERDFAIAYARCAWSMCHYVVLTEHPDAHAVLEDVRSDPANEGKFTRDIRAGELLLAFDLGTYAHAYRVLWALARRPKASLAYLKSIVPAPRFQSCAFREFGLGVVAAASQKVRAEALKALTRDATGAEGPSLDAVVRRISAALGRTVHELSATAEATEEYHLATGRLIAARLRTRSLEPGEDALASVPDDVARAVIGCVGVSFLGSSDPTEEVVRFATSLPWLAKARATELYLPKAWADVARLDDDGLYQFGVRWARSTHLDRPPPRVRATPKVGRNEPCPCGSGKKHKRCCAARPATA